MGAAYLQGSMMLELPSSLLTEPPGRVRYAACSQDPFMLAASEASRSSERRRSFQLAQRHVQNAAAAIENSRLQHAAASLVAAQYHSEGFIELSESYCSLVIDRAKLPNSKRLRRMHVAWRIFLSQSTGMTFDLCFHCSPSTSW
jgi:hypothetical protein